MWVSSRVCIRAGDHCALHRLWTRPPRKSPCFLLRGSKLRTSPGRSKPLLLQQAHSLHIDATKGLEPHTYTSGRWLRRDRVERDSRYIQFGFDALCKRVIELSPGASSIDTCRKIEGGFNRVFTFALNNDRRIVARFPFRIAGPAKLTTASEVATIQYLQAQTTIPIPTILDRNHDAVDSENPVGSEYIIMEHAPGVPLHEMWERMAGDQQVRCIRAIFQLMKQMVDLEFPAFGGIYLKNGPVAATSRQHLDPSFCIGPHCGTRYWDCDAGERRYYHYAQPNRGPWSDIGGYCDGLIDAGISRIPAVGLEDGNKPIYHGPAQTHLQLLKRARTVLKQMSQDQRVRDSSTPILFHPDLHMRNIFVSEDDPSLITSIIDWQGTSMEPAFWYSDEVPDFSTGSEVCIKAFELSSRFLTPRLSGPRLMNKNLFRPFRYSHRTWKDGAVGLQHELIETAQNWKELGFEGQCQFPSPSPEEMADYEKQAKHLVAAQSLRNDLASLLDVPSDGWVRPEKWESTTTSAAHKELFDGMLEAVLTNPNIGDDDEPVKDERTLGAIWPFDLDD